jgi:alpha-beta hydrolase superfamily lysophospholipase
VRRFDDLLDDLEVFLRRVADEHAGLPVVLVGHSMGGLVVTAFARERSGPIAAAAASAPPLKISEAISQTRVRAARLLRSVAPRLSLASGLDPNGLSRDVAVVQRYLDDPLVHRRMTTSLACELLGAVQRTAAAGPEAIQLPVLILHGDSDPICPLEGSRTFSEKLRTLGSELRVYPGLRHEIFNEPEYEDVFADLIAWFRGRLADAVPRPREAGRAR